jgi:lipid II:glycine glycyltransferase (peptidoglycan interpeptide bridge formation enzyme)
MDRADWDRAVREQGGSLLQSWRWGEFRRGDGWRVERVRVDGQSGIGMAQVLIRFVGPVGFAHVPRGPLVAGDGPAVLGELVAALDAVCRRHRAATLVLEPDQALPLPNAGPAPGFGPGPAHAYPDRTVVVPLRDDAGLLAQMHPKTRHQVRLAQRSGIAVEPMGDDETARASFYRLLADTAARNRFFIHGPAHYARVLDTFGDDAVLLLARADDEVAAGALVVRYGEEAAYFYGASSTVHRGHGAAHYLQYEAMRWARERGCVRYDLWGLAFAGEPEAVAAQARFKLRFGGEVVAYPPTLERRYRPIVGWLARRGPTALARVRAWRRL